MSYKIFCILRGGRPAFAVNIKQNEMVEDLKDAIKVKNKRELDTFATHELSLYQVAIDASNMRNAIEVAEAIFQGLDTSENMLELNPVDKLQAVFQGHPASRRVHILVRRPGEIHQSMGAPTAPPNYPEHASLIPYTPTRDEVIEERVKRFTINLQSQFGIYLNENVQLPLWQPPLELDDDTRRHLTGLNIPTISSSSPVPLLLLHNLGQQSHDAQLANRIDRLFSPESM